jgi:hypothetical protein
MTSSPVEDVKLLPCPFCASADITEARDDYGHPEAICGGCGVYVPLEWWNRRSAAPAVPTESGGIQGPSSDVVQNKEEAQRRDVAWLVERKVSPPQYITSDYTMPSLSSDPWLAHRFASSRKAQDCHVRLIEPLRSECHVVEHMFVYAPVGSAPKPDEGGSIAPDSPLPSPLVDRDAVIEECAAMCEDDHDSEMKSYGKYFAFCIRSLKSPPRDGE